jgi:hypothetical protein
VTQHEVLSFLEGLHEYMKRVSGKPSIPWPTREILRDNVWLNRQIWGRTWQAQYAAAVTEARRRGWIVAGPGEGCSVHCHAEHFRVTAEGAQALRLMNEDPAACAAHHAHIREACVPSGYEFRSERPVAA